MWRETLVSALLMAVGTVGAFILVTRDADWFYSFVPEALAGGRDPTATTQFLRGTLYEKPDAHHALSMLAAFLFTHNAKIALLLRARLRALPADRGPGDLQWLHPGRFSGAVLRPRPGDCLDRLADDPRGDRTLRRDPGRRGEAFHRLVRRLPGRPRSARRGGRCRAPRRNGHGRGGRHAVRRRPAGRLRPPNYPERRRAAVDRRGDGGGLGRLFLLSAGGPTPGNVP